MPADRLKFTLDTLVRSVTDANARTRQLEDELRTLKTKPATPPPAPEADDPDKDKSLADLLLEKPEKALDRYFGSKAQPVVQQLEALNQRLGDADLQMVRSSIEDFAEHEEDVLRLLSETGASRDRNTLIGAYTMVVGQKAIEEKQRQKRAALNPEAPAPGSASDPPKKQYTKTPLTEEIRMGLRMSEEEYYERYNNPSALEIKVPT